MILYNLFPLLAGKLSSWGPHLARASEMGFDWVFVNPIQKPGRSGSLYSVADYFDIHPALVDPASSDSPQEQVRSMVREANNLGLQMMVDLVINHTAVDSPLVTEHAAWYKQENGRVANPFCFENGHKVVWTDLAQLDHQHTSDPEGLFKFVVKVVEHYIDLGFRGFRCDAAYQIPGSFWKRLISHVKSKHPDLVFTAETLGCTADQTRETASSGFDYIFNSSKWWDYQGHWLLEQYNLTRETAPSISFPESHDTERVAAEAHGNVNALKQRYLFTALFSGGVMMPMGYEFGFKKRLHVVNTKPSDWEETDIDLREFIAKTNKVKATYKVFQDDVPTHLLYHHHNGNIMVMWKGSTRSREEALIILNRDFWNRSYFRVDALRDLVQSGAPLKVVSPENPLEYVHQPFEYDLRPGEGIVVVAER